MKNLNDPIGNRTRNLPASSAVWIISNRTIARKVSYRIFITEVRVPSQVFLDGIRGGLNASGENYSPCTSVFPIKYNTNKPPRPRVNSCYYPGDGQ